MHWLIDGWDETQWAAFGVGIAAGITLVLLDFSCLAEIGSVGAALILRWAIWQIPQPGRSRAHGTPPDAGRRLGQLLVAILLVLLLAEVIVAPFH